LCPACNGYGSWEFWGRRETCPVCGGSGEIEEEEEGDVESEDSGFVCERG